MSEFFKKRKYQKPRQEWNPHWSLKALYGLWHGVAAVLKIALGAVATVLMIGIVCGFVFIGILGGYLETDILPNAVEDLNGYELDQTSFIYYIDDDGDIQELQKIYTVTDRRWATIDEIPEDLVHAAVAIEDKRFYEHQGVDWITTVKACANLFMGDSSKFGGSTITQQLIKNLTGDDDVTVQRKLTEIFKAIQFERQYDKDVIMEWYLNTIFFGHGKFGVRSAAEQYFGKELELLTTAECASLISITNNPSLFDPLSTREFPYGGNPTVGADRNRIRQVNTLFEMRNQEYLSEEEYQKALAQEMVFKSGIDDQDRLADCTNPGCDYSGIVSTYRLEEEVYYCPSCGNATEIEFSASRDVYSWFVEAVIEDVCADMAALDGEDWDHMSQNAKNVYIEELKIAGYHIYSTIDMEVQEAVDAVYTDLTQIPTTQSIQQLLSAMVIVDNETGDIVAMAGNVGEKTNFFPTDYANKAKLQTGSTQKPLGIYAPAFEAGIITPATIVPDMPLYVNSDGSYFPRNDDRVYQYSRSVYTGIMRSVNAISVNTLEMLGLENSYNFAKNTFRLQGMTDSYLNPYTGEEMSDVGYSPLGMGALTLGVTVRDMSAAYATFANNGVYREARTYTKVYDSNGNLVLDNTQETEQILSEKTVNYMNYCLTAAVQSGTGTAAQISGQSVAGKTGTTASNNDRWFCGFTDYYTAAVWCGYKHPESIRLTGDGRNPACRLFTKVLTPVHEGLEWKQLYDTSNFRSYSMCLDSGMLSTSACGKDVRNYTAGLSRLTSAYAYSGDMEGKYCDKHVSVSYCTTGNGVATDYCAKMGGSVTTRSLVKLNAEEISEIRQACSVGLSSAYMGDRYVYYTSGNWHGFSGNAQPNVSAPYIVCSAHSEKAYDKYQKEQEELNKPKPDPEPDDGDKPADNAGSAEKPDNTQQNNTSSGTTETPTTPPQQSSGSTGDAAGTEG